MTDGLNVTPDPIMLLPNHAAAVTLPDEELYHYIRDDELDRIGETHRGLLTEICLTSAGIFFGSLATAIEGFEKYRNSSQLTEPQLISILLSFGALVSALITGSQWLSRRTERKTLTSEIRGRRKFGVRVAATPDL